MSYLEKLKKCRSRRDLAALLGYQPNALAYIVYKIPETDKYTSFNIPKKSGGERPILSPTPKLKTLQRRLANVLSICADEIFSKKVSDTPNKNIPSLSHGFKKGHSIITNAKRHKHKRYVFNIDLNNFFPSINFGRVRGFFIKNRDFQLHEDIATIIAQIACHNNQLPQGSPCSPVISNLIGHVLDVRLVQLAKKHQCTYSRYADDITFSTNLKFFPTEIACQQNYETKDWVVGIKLVEIVERMGFTINHSKTRMQYKQSRQVVTGLVVNRKVNVRREYYRLAKAMTHSLFTTGIYLLPSNQEEGTLLQLEGIFSHIYHIKNSENLGDDNANIKKKEKENSPVFKRLYAKLLYYKHFHALDKPLIICEGKTDNIYLKCAFRRLYPNKSHDEVRLFNYSTTTKDVLYLSGGSGDLATLIYTYKKFMKPFRCSGKKHPVIILIDNDDGAIGKGNPFRAAQSVSHSSEQIDGSKPFYHVIDNLYLLPTPKQNGKCTKIEDCFDPKTLGTMINGKKFNAENTKSGDNNEYGKFIFAEYVIKKEQAAIDFSGFLPIVTFIFDIITDYQKRLAAKQP